MNKALIIILLILLYSCDNKVSKLQVWEEVKKEIKNKNIAYLSEISADTIKCIECNNGKNWITKELFYKNHFNQMEISLNKQYVFFEQKNDDKKFNKKYKINYIINDKETIIYELLVNDDNVKFLGVFSSP